MKSFKGFIKKHKEGLEVLILFFVLLLVIFIGCFLTKPDYGEISDEQLNCEHEWHKVSSINSFRYVIYCPKCKGQQEVSEKEWKIIVINSEWEEKNK